MPRDLKKGSIVHIALCNPMTSIVQQCSSLGTCVISPLYTPNIKLPSDKSLQDKYRYISMDPFWFTLINLRKTRNGWSEFKSWTRQLVLHFTLTPLGRTLIYSDFSQLQLTSRTHLVLWLLFLFYFFNFFLHGLFYTPILLKFHSVSVMYSSAFKCNCPVTRRTLSNQTFQANYEAKSFNRLWNILTNKIHHGSHPHNMFSWSYL